MKVILNVLVVIISLNLWALEDSLFTNGNMYYEQGQYESAQIRYEKLVENGTYSFELYYNLGNVYYKLNQFPKAILYYEKAKKLNSSDEDLLSNLTLTNQRIVDQNEELENWDVYSYLASERTLTVYSLVLLFLAICMGVLFVWGRSTISKKIGLITGIVFVMLFVVTSILAFVGKSFLEKSNYAIVMTPVVHVKVEPNTEVKDAYILHEGSKVEVLLLNDGWVNVKFGSSKVGWLKQELLEQI